MSYGNMQKLIDVYMKIIDNIDIKTATRLENSSHFTGQLR